MTASGAPATDLAGITDTYILAGGTPPARVLRARAAARFTVRFGSLRSWRGCTLGQRMAVAADDRAFAAYAAVMATIEVDAGYVVASAAKWGRHMTARDPLSAATFRQEAASLGFTDLEVNKMWSKLAQICVITGRSPDTVTSDEYVTGREAFRGAVITKHGRAPKSLTTPLFCLDAVMFHRGRPRRQSPVSRG